MTKKAIVDIINPVHFHGALPLQSRYSDIRGLDLSEEAHVWYSPDNALSAFEGMQKKGIVHGDWKVLLYKRDEPLESMLEDSKGNVLVVACPNVDKMDVIYRAVQSGRYELVLADKPWVIEQDGLKKLRETIDAAKENGVLLVDIMTERYELGTIVQRMIMQDADLFGVLEAGSEEKPGIWKSSVHKLNKVHLGVGRPPAYFDTAWQGEGLLDVTTHLVDMANWFIRPDTAVNPEDVKLYDAERWPTFVDQPVFAAMTKTEERTPGNVYCNGQFFYTLDGKNIGIRVEWDIKANEDDEHYSRIEGSKIQVEVLKGPEDKHQTVYITPKEDRPQCEKNLDRFIEKMREQLGEPSISYVREGDRYKLQIPDRLYPTHFQHFAEQSVKGFKCLAGEEDWQREIEDSRLLTKYYLTTGALAMARRSK